MPIRKENNKPGSAKPAGVYYFMRRNALGTSSLFLFRCFVGTFRSTPLPPWGVGG